MADGILTPCNVARSWRWFRQVTAPCNVACGSGIVTVNSPSGSILQCDTWLRDDMPLNSLVAAPCNVTRSSGIMTLNLAGGSTLQCGRWLWDDMPLNSPKRPPYSNSIWFRFRPHHLSQHVVLHQSPKFYPDRQKKMTSCRFSRWRISAILDFKDPIMGSLKSPITTSLLNCLVFQKIAFLHSVNIQDGGSLPSWILGVP